MKARRKYNEIKLVYKTKQNKNKESKPNKKTINHERYMWKNYPSKMKVN